ncbi:MAG: hypothetical protein IKZ87_01300 [Actinomycetaceae bacterium]|nr:hypothetical protein [Actinomycetaceae bacterium]
MNKQLSRRSRRVETAVRRCNKYIGMLDDTMHRNRKSKATLTGAVNALNNLSDCIARDEVGELDWTDDVYHELSIAVHDYGVWQHSGKNPRRQFGKG